MRVGRYDTAFSLDRSPLLGLLPWLAAIPRRIGLDSSGRGFAHTVRVAAPPAAPRHEAEVYLDTLRAVGLAPAAPHLEFFPSPADEAEAQRLMTDDIRLMTNHQSFILLHPAGGVNPGMTLLAKRWPAERFAQLADRLADDLGMQVVLVGGPGDREVSAEVMRHTRRPLLDLTGRLRLGALGALARHAALYIGNDTGATHLAVAVGAPTLMLMGPTDPRRYGPYRPTAPDTVAYAAPPAARPDDYLALRAAAHLQPDSPLSIQRVSVDQVYTTAQRLLARSALEAKHAPPR
ncbi:MAG: glycosyltransferase family 9 protein [Anaerolineae bacterium]|nr:glycosyltransferase family 9 protein [Anaerolineae bacterium]